ncbi:MAG: hypothetical protein U9M97_03235 [Candidatus Hadarchaeota archaeon]|nr:hypothetical protein [Candidatus Hadarchaeota archaeon]
MPRVNVSINYISGEKFWEAGKPTPPKVHISTNVNIIGVESKDKGLAVPFVVTISYNPSVAQISLKGQAFVAGTESELEKIQKDYKEKKKPPRPLVQRITGQSLVEATVLSRTLNVPPPIPLPGLPPERKPDKERPSYVG